jgi:hypothetical protein
MPVDCDTSSFEPLHGERFFWFLDRHPDDRHVALQVIASLHTSTERAGVWDRYTGKLVWTPEGVSAIAWLHGGEQVALIHEEYHRAPVHPARIGSPLQREFSYTFIHTTWAELCFIDSCGLAFPTGWPVDLVLSPREDLAIVKWRDQEESGLEFVALGETGPQQIERTGLPHLAPLGHVKGDGGGGFPLNTPLVTRAAFSPDGRYIVMAWQDDPVWWSSESYQWNKLHGRTAPASPDGEFTMGTISLINWDERTHHAVPLVGRLPTGWRPEPRDDGGEGLLIEAPVFVDAEHFTLALPIGETRTFSVR